MRHNARESRSPFGLRKVGVVFEWCEHDPEQICPRPGENSDDGGDDDAEDGSEDEQEQEQEEAEQEFEFDVTATDVDGGGLGRGGWDGTGSGQVHKQRAVDIQV